MYSKQVRRRTRTIELRVKLKQICKAKIEGDHHLTVAENTPANKKGKTRLHSADIIYSMSKLGKFYMVVIIDLKTHSVIDRYIVSHVTKQL